MNFQKEFPMKIGFVFHKDPCQPPVGIDILRLNALTESLKKRGMHVDILAPVGKPCLTACGTSVYPVDYLQNNRQYDILKTCYHFSMELIADFKGPVVSRLVRVVDENLPERDETWRLRLLKCQEMIRKRSSAVIFNNKENAERWRRLYGKPENIMLIPTGCPSVLPSKGRSPYDSNEQAVLFLGSLASGRMAEMISKIAERLKGVARVHYIGQNKCRLYGNGQTWRLSPSIVQHGEKKEDSIWNYIRHARIGLAVAPGPHLFDNDLSKIYSYLRGGLRVLSEERIINNDLVKITEWGNIFRYGDVDDAAATAVLMMKEQISGHEETVMSYMAKEHNWENRAFRYHALFRQLQAEARKTWPY